MTPFEKVAKEHIASRGSPDTRDLYMADLARWVLFCQLGNYDVNAPTLEAATSFRDHLLTKQPNRGGTVGLSATTTRRIISALSKMYKVAVARQLATWNPFDTDAMARPPRDDVSMAMEFSKPEAEAILAAAEKDTEYGARDYAVMRLLYDTGMRVSSAASLRRDALRRHPDGSRSLVTKVKYQGRVEIKLTAETSAALDRWLAQADESPWVFPAKHRHITRRAIGARVAHYGALVGIKDAHPHRFRATFISDALDVLPLHEVQAAVHHADPKTTLKYDRHKRGAGVTAAVAKMRSKTE